MRCFRSIWCQRAHTSLHVTCHKCHSRIRCWMCLFFCLALMGINFLDFLREARRVTKVYGCLIVAEVRSRIEEPRRFLRTFTALGFDLRHKDIRNSHFVLYVFQRMDRRVDEAKLQTLAPRLLPCLYKKR
eukprot:Rmarinus@m.7080